MAYGWTYVMLVLSGITLIVGEGGKAADHGEEGRTLRPCPASPNCVSTMSIESRHALAPLRFAGAPDAAFARLKGIVRLAPRSNIVFEDNTYIHAEFRTLLGFVDDVEFLLDRSAGIIHMRSASRLGYWDLGVNRKRLEEIRRLFGEADSYSH